MNTLTILKELVTKLESIEEKLRYDCPEADGYRLTKAETISLIINSIEEVIELAEKEKTK